MTDRMTPAITYDKISDFVSKLDGAGRICIVTHFHPDGDAIGSSTALMHYLMGCRGKEKTSVIFPSPTPDNLSFLIPEHGVFEATDPCGQARRVIAGADLIIGVDFNDFSRTDSLTDCLKSSKAVKVLIDHHLNPSAADFDLVFSETEISSASELLYEILMEMPDIRGDAALLPEKSRISLMTGMTTDTNNFANSVFPGTLEMASRLLAAGVDRDDILNHIYHSHRENRLRLMGVLLDKGMKITADGVAYMIIDRNLAEEFDIRDGETEGFVNLPLAVKEVRMSILLKEDGDHFRASVRSKKGISANNLARTFFHGGGHEQAAGGKVYIPQDVQDPCGLGKYLENITARFMQNQSAR